MAGRYARPAYNLFRAGAAAKRSFSAMAGGASAATAAYQGAKRLRSAYKKISKKFGRIDRKPKGKLARMMRSRRPVVSTVLNGDLKLNTTHITVGKGKNILPKVPPNKITCQFANYVWSNTQGVQAVNELPTVGTRSQLLGAAPDAQGYQYPDNTVNDSTRWPVGVFATSANSNFTGGTTFYGWGAVNNQNRAAFLQSMNYELDITNFTEIACEYVVLFVTHKKVSSTSPVELWDQLGTIEKQNWKQVVGPSTTVDVPNIDQPSKAGLTGASGAPNRYTWGQMPTFIPDWNKNFKILKAEKFVLQPGAAKRTKYIMHYNKKIYERVLYGLAGIYIPGVTVTPIVIARPKLVANPTAELLKVYPGPVQYGWSVALKVCVKDMKTYQKALRYNNPGFADPQYLTERANQQNVDDEDKINIPDVMIPT